MAIELRDATSDDAEGLVALKRRLFGETQFMLYAPDEYAATPETAANSISRVQKSGNSRLLLALDDSEAIAFLGAYGTDVPRRKHTAQIVIGVLRAYWGRGIAASLLREAIRWAPTVSISRLELGVMTDNVRAIGLYSREGFRIEGTRKCAYLIDGRSIDEHVMALVAET